MTKEEIIEGIRYHRDHPALLHLIDDNWDYLLENRVDLTNIIACGGNGCVFPIKGMHGIVAKLTTSRDEFFYFDKIANKYNKSILPKIYMVDTAPKDLNSMFFSKNLYVIIREDIIPVHVIEPPPDFRALLEEISAQYSAAARFLSFNKKKLTKIAWDNLKKLEDVVKNSEDQRLHRFLDDLLFFAKKGIVFFDVTYKNIGLSSNNEFKIYDAFYEEDA